MANEAVIIELLGNKGEVIDFTCADATSISKGTILKLTTPRLAIASSGLDVTCGIAAADKLASDGAVNIGAYTYGIFDLKNATSSITTGQIVSLSGANLIHTATEAEIASGKGLGRALEDMASNAVGEVLVAL